jgi:hypothetical protein
LRSSSSLTANASPDQVAELGGGRNDPANVLRRERDQRRRLGREAGGERRLTGEHRDIGGEGPRSALREVAVTLRCLVDDVQGPGFDDVQGSLALAVLEDEIPARERQPRADLRQVLDLGLSEAGEEDRVGGVEEVLHRGWRVLVGHSLVGSPFSVTRRTRPRAHTHRNSDEEESYDR